MRHYERVSYRHLNDSERFRDHEYLADDAWVGASEGVPELRQTFDGDRRGDDDRGDSDPPALTHRLESPRRDDGIEDRSFSVRSLVRRIVRGLFQRRRPRK